MNSTSRPEAARTQRTQENSHRGGVGSRESLRMGPRGDGRGDPQSPAGCRGSSHNCPGEAQAMKGQLSPIGRAALAALEARGWIELRRLDAEFEQAEVGRAIGELARVGMIDVRQGRRGRVLLSLARTAR